MGSTDDPRWYARQLMRVEAAFRVEEPDDLAEACRRLGRVLLAAASSVTDESGTPRRSD